jgi:pimeloyl-ACP methyl ester carboxylesterase
MLRLPGPVALCVFAACGPLEQQQLPPPPQHGELALAAALPAQCGGAEIFRIHRQVSSTDPSMGSFSYGYRYKAPTHQGAPVLVYLPGGPGMTSTDTVPQLLPAGWGYLLTDPRGTGCNTFARVPPSDVSSALFQSRELAGDAAAAIADRGLDHYILYGISYGTLLATLTAEQVEKTGTPPIAVVMEGVLGRALQSGESAAAPAISQWQRLRTMLPPEVLQELDSAPVPYGISAEGWSRALGQILLAGTETVTFAFNALDDPLTHDAALQQLQQLAGTPELAAPLDVELYRQIACREIDDSTPVGDLDPVFEQGELVPNAALEGTKCAGLHVSAPYDSAKHPFTTKAYYFIGDSDVATPPSQGAYHFDHHAGSATRVVSLNGGHLSLQLDQQLCASDVLSSIATGGADLLTVLVSECPLQTNVDMK